MQGNQLLAPPQRTRPYRSKWIVSVIQELYFTGGVAPFARRFEEYVGFVSLAPPIPDPSLDLPLHAAPVSGLSTNLTHLF
jgi:hypothetical protein